MYKSHPSAGAHTYSMNQLSTASELRACTVQPAAWPGWGRSECAVGEKRSPAAVSLRLPPSLSVAGSRWQGMAARHSSLGCQEMAIIAGTPWLSVPLSPLRKVLLYARRDSSPKVCACVARRLCVRGKARRRSTTGSLF